MFQKLQTLKPIRIAIDAKSSYTNKHGLYEKHVLSNEMRKAMKDGIERKLCPLKEYNKPTLKLDKESKIEIREIKKKIKKYNQEISKIEWKKSLLETSGDEIKDLNNTIEMTLYKIFELQAKLRNIKIEQYKKQLSSANLDKIV